MKYSLKFLEYYWSNTRYPISYFTEVKKVSIFVNSGWPLWYRFSKSGKAWDEKKTLSSAGTGRSSVCLTIRTGNYLIFVIEDLSLCACVQEPIYTPRILREPERTVQFDMSHLDYIPGILSRYESCFRYRYMMKLACHVWWSQSELLGILLVMSLNKKKIVIYRLNSLVTIYKYEIQFFFSKISKALFTNEAPVPVPVV
jgi:hypothetical protein